MIRLQFLIVPMQLVSTELHGDPRFFATTLRVDNPEDTLFRQA